MRVIEGQYADLIDPFPRKEIHRVYGWMHCYRTMTESDISPKTPEEFDSFFNSLLNTVVSYGIIDKQNLTNSKHEAPLVGIITFEPHTIWNGFVHVASTRKAWGKGIMDEAGQLVIKDLFDNLPSILRLSAWIFKNNIPAQHYVVRAGFRKEGVLRDYILQDGAPKTIFQYGLTRREYATSSDHGSDSRREQPVGGVVEVGETREPDRNLNEHLEPDSAPNEFVREPDQGA